MSGVCLSRRKWMAVTFGSVWRKKTGLKRPWFVCAGGKAAPRLYSFISAKTGAALPPANTVCYFFFHDLHTCQVNLITFQSKFHQVLKNGIGLLSCYQILTKVKQVSKFRALYLFSCLFWENIMVCRFYTVQITYMVKFYNTFSSKHIIFSWMGKAVSLIRPALRVSLQCNWSVVEKIIPDQITNHYYFMKTMMLSLNYWN